MSTERFAGWANWCPRGDCWSSQSVPGPDRRVLQTDTGFCIEIEGVGLILPQTIARSTNVWYGGWFFRFVPSVVARPVPVPLQNTYFLTWDHWDPKFSKKTA